MKYNKYAKNADNKTYSIRTKLWFGRHIGKTIEEVLKEDRTYVTKFLMQDKGMKIIGITETKKVSDRTWGYDAGAGLVCNYMFYNEYVVSKAKLDVVRIACKLTGLIVDGNTLAEAVNKLNQELDGI